MSDDRPDGQPIDGDPDPAPVRPDPPRKGLVWCCDTLGWVRPDVAFDHRWENTPPDRWSD